MSTMNCFVFTAMVVDTRRVANATTGLIDTKSTAEVICQSVSTTLTGLAQNALNAAIDQWLDKDPDERTVHHPIDVFTATLADIENFVSAHFNCDCHAYSYCLK